MHKTRILIADDHEVVRKGVRSLIAAQPDFEVVGEAACGESACALAERLRPDLVVMDVTMPGLTGDRATAQIKLACPSLKVLALTVHEDREHLRRLLKAGADGYVLKLATADELIHAIQVVTSGGVYIDPAVAGKVVVDLFEDRGDGDSVKEDSLTQREIDVILRVAQGYSNKEIAAQLDISVKTVETHKLRSMNKIGLKSRVDVVQFALRRGWLTTS